MPNKKAAYELTHIVFYLSEYGRKDPELSAAALRSLEYAGILAYLDQNADLLAEVCVAMRYAGYVPSPVWEGWLERDTHRFTVEAGSTVSVQDDYHEYFVCNWMLACAGRDNFVHDTDGARIALTRPAGYAGPLRHLSQHLFDLDQNRNADWQVMRDSLTHDLDEIGLDILIEAEQSTEHFDAFFAGFARTGLRGMSL